MKYRRAVISILQHNLRDAFHNMMLPQKLTYIILSKISV